MLAFLWLAALEENEKYEEMVCRVAQVKESIPMRVDELLKGKRESEPTAPNPERPDRMMTGIVR